MHRLALVLLLLTGSVACAQPVLYRAQSYTTGTDDRDRAAACPLCAGCLVQVSGNPALLKASRVADLAAEPETLVSDYVYLDRMTGVPHHDEQGSRDRPYDLIVQFDPARIDAILARLGERLWPGRVQIMLTQRADTGLLTADGVFDERQRRALLAAADKILNATDVRPFHGGFEAQASGWGAARTSSGPEQSHLSSIREVAAAEERDHVRHAAEALVCVARKLDLEGLLKFHRELDDVEAVQSEILGKPGPAADFDVRQADGPPDGAHHGSHDRLIESLGHWDVSTLTTS